MGAWSEEQVRVTTTRLRVAGCVFADAEARLILDAASTPEALESLLAARVGGAPLEHVLGWAEFCGLRVLVDPGVFVPRPRTEALVREAISCVGDAHVVVDLCCGTGAVGLAIVTALQSDDPCAADPCAVDLYAVDLDPDAVACARRNLAGVGGLVFEGDLFDPLPADLLGRVGVVVANAPYVPTDALRTMPVESRLHEKALALDGGPDGVAFHRRLAHASSAWLAPGGHLLVETSTRQAGMTRDAFAAFGLHVRQHVDQETRTAVVVGTREQS